MFRFSCRLLICDLVVGGIAFARETPGDKAQRTDHAVSAEGAALFEKKIRPVLVKECYECHSSEKGKMVRRGLALDTREGIRKGDNGPAIVPGSPAQSLLIGWHRERWPRRVSSWTKTPLKVNQDSSGRLELAEWIANRENPQTARVMVNRVWQNLFGRGLVPGADDFGLTVRRRHPELLDHLAHRFMADGWSVK